MDSRSNKLRKLVRYIERTEANSERLCCNGLHIGANPSSIISEMQYLINLKPIKWPLIHTSISFHEKDRFKVSNQVMAEIANDYAKYMGFENCCYLAVRHNNSHPHFHFVGSLVDVFGNRISDSYSAYQGRTFAEGIERKYDLVQSQLCPPIRKQKIRKIIEENELEDVSYGYDPRYHWV